MTLLLILDYDGTSSPSGLIVFDTSGNSYITTGNFGIGTANPSGGKLQVENTSGTALRIISNTSQWIGMGSTGRFK